jgi:hypothetical protein
VRLTAYLHVAPVGRWESIARTLLERIDAAGLRSELARLVLGWCGPGPVPGWLWGCGDVAVLSDTIFSGEVPTLRRLRDDCRADPTGHVLYLHVKGANHQPGPTDPWRDFLADGVITRWRECVAALEDGYDAAGNEWYGPEREAEWRRVWAVPGLDLLPHFSGNFWWARRAYVAGLPDVPFAHRWDAEYRFIGTGSPRVYCPEFAGLNWYAGASAMAPNE